MEDAELKTRADDFMKEINELGVKHKLALKAVLTNTDSSINALLQVVDTTHEEVNLTDDESL